MIRQEVAAAVSAHAPVVRRSQNGFPSVRRVGFLPRSALAEPLEHARPRRPRRPTSRAPPNARPSNPHSPSPLAVAISAARGFLPRRLSDAGPSALASASVPGRRPKPLATSGRRECANSGRSLAARRTDHFDPLLPFPLGARYRRNARMSGPSRLKVLHPSRGGGGRPHEGHAQARRELRLYYSLLEHFPFTLHRILRRRDSWRILAG